MRFADKENITGSRGPLLTQTERRGTSSGKPRTRVGFLYQVYGLTIKSEIELPELVPVTARKHDVRIQFGKVPETLESIIEKWPWCIASADEFLFNIDGVAKYHIAGGEKITIERRLGLEGSVPGADIRLWLLGTALAALLHQRSLLPLHVSAIRAPGGTWAFTGESGEGKSTLAGFLHRRFGHDLISDDVSVINPQNTDPVIYPGPRKLKLWADALEYLEFKGCIKVRDLSNTDKFQLYLDADAGYRIGCLGCLDGLVLLESVPEDEDATIERLHGIEAFNIAFRAIYRPYMNKWFRKPEKLMLEVAALCGKVSIYRFCRPRSLANFEKNLEPLLKLIKAGDK